MQKLKDKERAVLDYISREIATRGYAPSVRDICAALGFASTSTAQAYLDRLERSGYLRREGGRSRSIVLCDASTPQPIAVIRGAGERETLPAFVPDLLYCGRLEGEETPTARWDEVNAEYLICIGERPIARLKPIEAKTPTDE